MKVFLKRKNIPVCCQNENNDSSKQGIKMSDDIKNLNDMTKCLAELGFLYTWSDDHYFTHEGLNALFVLKPKQNRVYVGCAETTQSAWVKREIDDLDTVEKIKTAISESATKWW